MMSHVHQFDTLSGWCLSCGTRDDGRVIDKFSGLVIKEGEPFTPAKRAKHQAHVEAELDRRGIPRPGQRKDHSA